MVKPHLRATGLRTHDARHDGRSYGAAEDFLLQSRLRRGDAEMGLSVARWFGEDAGTVLSMLDRGVVHGSGCVVLPPSVALEMSLGAAIRQRRSTRRYR